MIYVIANIPTFEYSILLSDISAVRLNGYIHFLCTVPAL